MKKTVLKTYIKLSLVSINDRGNIRAIDLVVGCFYINVIFYRAKSVATQF